MRVVIANLQALQTRKDAIKRYIDAYRETVDWMYSDPAALKTYADFAGITEAKAKFIREHFFPNAVLSPDKIDANPLLLGVKNGVIDLQTGTFREARREDLVSKIAGCSYDEHARCPNWDAFLLKIFDHNEELIRYVQRVAGYMLTGLTVEEVLFVMWGLGANGKSTFRETIFALLGDYAIGADASLLITNRRQGGATPDLARLFGRRLVTVNETEDKDHLNESRIKFITSK